MIWTPHLNVTKADPGIISYGYAVEMRWEDWDFIASEVQDRYIRDTITGYEDEEYVTIHMDAAQLSQVLEIIGEYA